MEDEKARKGREARRRAAHKKPVAGQQSDKPVYKLRKSKD